MVQSKMTVRRLGSWPHRVGRLLSDLCYQLHMQYALRLGLVGNDGYKRRCNLAVLQSRLAIKNSLTSTKSPVPSLGPLASINQTIPTQTQTSQDAHPQYLYSRPRGPLPAINPRRRPHRMQRQHPDRPSRHCGMRPIPHLARPTSLRDLRRGRDNFLRASRGCDIGDWLSRPPPRW
jgi:hypothetical protein